ncbi:hypothetical protein CFC21_050372 [Triticum aestivum]|uniref:glucan endo-1,3-beta-D-glucosidase n=2 Tax=Triticum aestivum TaxID=4565 RepID=A0A3B6H288_WHEAT|nr:glucan endo-1,3-beta-glucosidase 8-like [Triticum aestivum]KAF7040471.1 hypothetical protein CFC21_050372 [Triticum aestivum]
MACCAAVVAVVLAAAVAGAPVEGLGVNWGTLATRRLPPKVMAQLLKDNGFKKVKIFDADETTMMGLAGTGIETMIAVPNDMLAAVAADYRRAKEWVKMNVTKYDYHGGVNIKFVAIGNEPFLTAYNGTYDNVTVPALKNIQRALDEAGHGSAIKATVPVNADVYDSPASNPVPSAGKFRDDVAAVITDMVRFLNHSGAPFSVNIYPFLSLYGNDNFPIDYAFFDGAPPNPVIDNGVNYTNVFDANFDTLVSALDKIGFGSMPVVIGEVGWPTDGDKHATVPYAERFYNGLLKRLAARQGTPLRPHASIEVYLFGLMDEDAKSVAPGNFERHWGIFTFDGRPKFPLDLRGNGRPVMPAGARGVQYLPRRWCVLSPNASTNATAVEENVAYACSRADCTPLGYACSCGALDAAGNASYAFNAYYQAQGQVPLACDFQGLALVTDKDVSRPPCNFTVQVVAESRATAVTTNTTAAESMAPDAAAARLTAAVMAFLLVLVSA